MHLQSFSGKILLLGYGGVARCTLPLILRHIDVRPSNIMVMDMTDQRHRLQNFLEQGITFLQERLTEDDYARQLSKLVGAGDMIIDLAWNIACTDMLQWCRDNNVLYINTSVELWDPYKNLHEKKPVDRTLYVRHMAIRDLTKSWEASPGATAVLEHGANPGLVSHFTKQALLDIGEKFLKEKPSDPRWYAIDHTVRYENFAELGRLLGIKVIHISEIDTQLTSLPHDPDVFHNTWSVEGFFEEGIAPAEMGWGTHERSLPADACEHVHGPKNQICLNTRGIDTFVKSRVPSGEITAMVVRHGEAFTLSDYLTVWNDRGEAIHRPTVHYAYCPSPAAVRSLEDVRLRGYRMQNDWKILGDDITSGADELGVLLMGHDFKGWWTGSILSIDHARTLVPGQNATTLQVAASILSAVCWMIRNPRKGVMVPDQLPHREILDIARPYLGDTVSLPIDWTPAGGTPNEKTWQFESFRLPDAKGAGPCQKVAR